MPPKKKIPLKSAEELAEIEETRLASVTEQLVFARNIAKTLFKNSNPTPDWEEIDGVYDRLVDGASTEEDAAQDLLRAKVTYTEIYGAEAIVHRGILFAIFDKLFFDGFEEEEEEEEPADE